MWWLMFNTSLFDGRVGGMGEECKTLDEGTAAAAAQKHTDGEQELLMSHHKFAEVNINGQLLKNDGRGRPARGGRRKR